MSPEAMLEERVRIVVHEVNQGRVERDEKAVAAYVRKAFRQLPEPEQAHIYEGVLRVMPPSEKPKERPPRPRLTLSPSAPHRPSAAAIIRKQPELTATAVYHELAKVHKIQVSLSSIPPIVTEARKLARGDRPIAAPAPTRTPEKPRPRTAVERRPAAASPPAKKPRAAAPPPAPLANGAPFHDGDKISIEINGERLDARRGEGRWLVEFEGIIEDGLMAKLMGRMVAGVAG